jgi:hypothetical protein
MRLGSLAIWGIGFSCAISLSYVARADDLKAQVEALNAINAFAGQTCGDPLPFDGRSDHLELSGDIKAQLAGVIAKVADLGISGAGKYKNESFKNVMHEQLAQALKDGANCKLEVFKVLQEKMIMQR